MCAFLQSVPYNTCLQSMCVYVGVCVKNITYKILIIHFVLRFILKN